MKTGTKILLVILVIAVIGLTAGLVLVMMNNEEKGREVIETLTVGANDTHLSVGEPGEDEIPTYTIDLNNYNTFSLSYASTPTNLKSYLISVKVNSDVISITSGSEFLGSQTGAVQFSVDPNYIPESNTPITITFTALNGKNSNAEEVLVSKVNILLTRPSKLDKVTNIAFDGTKLTWDPVVKNVNGVLVDSDHIRYLVNLTYFDEAQGIDINSSFTTNPGVTEFSESKIKTGFPKGVINTISVTAIGDSVNTNNADVSEEYKFCILKTPTFEVANSKITITNIDTNANGIVLYKTVGEKVTYYKYIQKGADPTVLLSEIKGSDKMYKINVSSTLAATAFEFKMDEEERVQYETAIKEYEKAVEDYKNNQDLTEQEKLEKIEQLQKPEFKVKTVVKDGVAYFNSPYSDYVDVTYLDTPEVSMSTGDVVDFNGVETFGKSMITWTLGFEDVLLKRKVNYLVTIKCGDKSKTYTLSFEDFVDYDTPYMYITSDMLASIKNDNVESNTFSFTVKAFMPMSESDTTGAEGNVITDGKLLMDSSTSTAFNFIQYRPNNSEFKISVDEKGVLNYVIPSFNNTKYIGSLDLIFVSLDETVVESQKTTSSGSINLLNLLKNGGEYYLYIAIKGVSGVINIQPFKYSTDCIYKTIGETTNLTLTPTGLLSYDKLENANSYDITLTIGDTSKTINTDKFENINIIEFINTYFDGAYTSVAGNSSEGDAYTITVTTKSNKAGWFGAPNSIEFKKFDSIGEIEEGTNVIYEDGVIKWKEVNGAKEYTVVVNGATAEKVTTNFYNYTGLLNEGDNTFTIGVLGKSANQYDVTYLYSNTITGNITKLTKPNNVYIQDNILYWNGEKQGTYEILVYNNNTLVETINYTSTEGELNSFDLTQINNGVEVAIREVKDRCFASDLTEKFAFEYLTAPVMSVAKVAGEYYLLIANNDNATKLNLDGVTYTLADMQQEVVAGYKGIKLSGISSNDSLGLTNPQKYTLSAYIYNDSKFVDFTENKKAYFVSQTSTISIQRLATPTFKVEDFDIQITCANASKYSLIAKDADQNVKINYLDNNKKISTKGLITESGAYSIEIQGLGNVDETAKTLTTYILDSVVKKGNVEKLSAPTIVVAEVNGWNQIQFEKKNTTLNYTLYENGTKTTAYTADGTTKLTLDLDTDKNATYTLAYTKADYITSEVSNAVTFVLDSFATSDFEFDSANVIKFQNNANAKRYEITFGENENKASYVVNTIDNTFVLQSENTNLESTLATGYKGGIKLVDGYYYINIADLISNKIIPAGTLTTFTISTIGNNTVDASGNYTAYNCNKTYSESVTYHNLESGVVTISDVMIIDLNEIPTGYTNIYMTLKYGNNYNTSEFYSFTTTTQGTVVGSNDNSINISKSGSKLNIDMSNYSAGDYSVSIYANKKDNLGVATNSCDTVTFTKLKTFGNYGESLKITDGYIGVTGIPEGNNTYKFTVSQNGKTTKTLNVADNQDSLDLNTDKLAVGTFTVSIAITGINTIISDSVTYTFDKLNTPTNEINVKLIYKSDYSLRSYEISWNSNNMSGGDLVSKYLLVQSNANGKTWNREIEANKSGTGLVYNSGKYAYSVSASSNNYNTFTLTATGQTATNLNTSTTYYVTNPTPVVKTITYLEAPSDSITITNGELNVELSTEASSAILIIYAGEDTTVAPVYTKELTESESFSFQNNVNIPAGKYTVNLRYIGNDYDTVTSGEYSTIITKLDNQSVEVVDGKLQIVDLDSSYTYKYSIGNSQSYKTLTHTDGVINTSTWEDGDFTINIYAIANDMLVSDITSFNLYKSSVVEITDASIENPYNEGKDSIVLEFISNNRLDNIDRVGKYTIYINGVEYDTFNPTDSVTATNGLSIARVDYIDGESQGYKYTITFTNITNLFTTYENISKGINNLNFTVQASSGSYIANPNSSNTLTAGKFIKLNHSTTTANQFVKDDNLFVYSYNGSDKVSLFMTITNNTDHNSYTYSAEFDRNSGSGATGYVKEIDFTTTKVMKVGVTDESYTGEYIPAGSYTVNITYISKDATILNSDSTEFLSVPVIATVIAISIDDFKVSWQKADGVSYTYSLTGAKTENKTISDNFIDFTNYPAGDYSMTIYCTANDSLKSKISETFTFKKLAKTNNFDTIIEKTDSSYNLVTTFTIPPNNLNGNLDLATNYALTVMLGTTKYVYNIDPTQISTTAINVTSSTANAPIIEVSREGNTYKVVLKITKVSQISVDSDKYTFNNTASTVVINEISNFQNISFTLDKLSGNTTNLISANDTQSKTINKFQNTITFTKEGGKLKVNGLVKPASNETLIMNLYKKVENELLYTKTMSWEWTASNLENSIITSFADGSYFENLNLATGEYLITTEYISDSQIDSDMCYEIFSVAKTPMLYTSDGVLTWENIGEENVTYVLYKVDGSTLTEVKSFVDEYSYTDNTLTATGYKYVIKAYVDYTDGDNKVQKLYSPVSDTFTAVKLANPSIKVINKNGSRILTWTRDVDKPVDQATKYLIYKCKSNGDGEFAEAVLETTVIVSDLTQTNYSYAVTYENTLGKYNYMIIAVGDTSKSDIDADGVFAYNSIGYLNSYNDFANPVGESSIVSIEFITNTVSNIGIINGNIVWDAVDNAEYYMVYVYVADNVKTNPEDPDSETKKVYRSVYTTSTTSTSRLLNIATVDIADLNNAKDIRVYIELKNNSTEYIPIQTIRNNVDDTTTATDDSNLKSINVFKHIMEAEDNANEAYSNLRVSNGYLSYTISYTYLTEYASILGLDISNLTLDDLVNNTKFYSFTKPNLHIAELGYVARLGLDLYKNYYLAYNSNSYSNTSSDLAGVKVTDDVVVYIPLPESYASGKYTIYLSFAGATTQSTNEPNLVKTIVGDSVVGYKLDRVTSPKVNEDLQNYGAKVPFTLPATRDENTYVSKYQLYFENIKIDATGTTTLIKQFCDVTIASKESDYTLQSSVQLLDANNGYQGYIDSDGNVVIDLYTLFVENNYSDVVLEEGTKYSLYIRAYGGSVISNDGVSNVTVKYYNSSLSTVKSTFTILKQLKSGEISITGTGVTWTGQEGAVGYMIYFNQTHTVEGGEATARMEDYTYSQYIEAVKNTASYVYSDIKDNENLSAGVYKISVVAIGDGNEFFSSRRKVDITGEKLEAVTVSLVDGRYVWTNPRIHIESNAPDAEVISSAKRLFSLNFNVDVYNNLNQNVESMIISSKSSYEFVSDEYDDKYVYTFFDLATKYRELKEVSLDITSGYKLNVYSYTNTKSSNSALLQSDSTINFDSQIYRYITPMTASVQEEDYKLDYNSNLTIIDDNSSQKEYVVFAYETKGIVVNDYDDFTFMTNHTQLSDSRSINMYGLNGFGYKTDADGNKVRDYGVFAPNVEDESKIYLFTMQALMKDKHTDEIDEFGNVIKEAEYLRSEFTTPLSFKYIKQPELAVKNGTLYWKTNTGLINTENGDAYLTIDGELYEETVTGGYIKRTAPLYVKQSKSDTQSLKLEKLLVDTNTTISNGETIVESYCFPYIDTADATIDFIENSNYKISVKFLGSLIEDVSQNYSITNANNTYTLSSLTSVINTAYVLQNPGKPVNPRSIDVENYENKKLVTENIPSDTGYYNYIYFNQSTYSDSNNVTHKTREYDVIINRIYEEEVNGEIVKNTTLAFTYNIRLNAEGKLAVTIVDENGNIYTQDGANPPYVTELTQKIDGVTTTYGYYVALEYAIEATQEYMKNTHDGKEYTLQVHVRSVGNSNNYKVEYDQDNNVIEKIYNLTHYSPITESNSLSVSIPNPPTDIVYNSGILTWNNMDLGEGQGGLKTEIAIAYQVDGSGITSTYIPGYADIHTSYLRNGAGQWFVYDETIGNYKVIHSSDRYSEEEWIELGKQLGMEILGVTSDEYDEMFGDNHIYRIDIAKVGMGVEEYKLKYLTPSIKCFTLRTIGPLGDSQEETFVSLPTVKIMDGASFKLFASGNGSAGDPFVIKTDDLYNTMKVVSQYFDEYIYYRLESDSSISLNNWAPLGLNNSENKQTFNGVMDFNNISLTIELSIVQNIDGYYYLGMFYKIAKDSVITNLNVTFSDQTHSNTNQNVRAGLIAVYNEGLIANVSISGNVTLINTDQVGTIDVDAGGVTYDNDGMIAFTDVTCNLKIVGEDTQDKTNGKGRLAGISYCGSGQINVSSYSGTLKAYNVGGIMYESNGATLNYCTFLGSIENFSEFGGGTAYISTFVTYINEGLTADYCYIKPARITIKAPTKNINNYYLHFGGLLTQIRAGASITVSNSAIDFGLYQNADYTISGTVYDNEYAGTSNTRFCFAVISSVSISGINFNNIEYNYDDKNSKMVVFGVSSDSTESIKRNTSIVSSVYYSSLTNIRKGILFTSSNISSFDKYAEVVNGNKLVGHTFSYDSTNNLIGWVVNEQEKPAS